MVSQVWLAIMHISEGDAPSRLGDLGIASGAGLWRLAVSSTLKSAIEKVQQCRHGWSWRPDDRCCVVYQSER
jgi:hypothetical protein